MKIDLGQSYDELMPTSPEKMEKVEKKHYPAFHYEGSEKLELPEEGTMTIHFCKTASSVSERDGVKHYSCTVEVKHILDVEAEKDDAPTRKSSRGAEDALDKLMAEVIGRRSKDEAY